jgi:peptidoglycan/LPS O-acetylase OafA/YrhL
VHTTPHEGLHHALVAAHPEPSDLSRRIGEALMPVTFSYCVLWLAFRLPIRRFARHGDLSYGTYIYAFPIQQLLALYGLNRWGMPVYVALVLAGTLPVAFLSWRLVEKPWLSLKTFTPWLSLRRISHRTPTMPERLSITVEAASGAEMTSPNASHSACQQMPTKTSFCAGYAR